MVVASLLSRFVDGNGLSKSHVIGMGILMAGLLFIAADQSGAPDGESIGLFWVGDLCFVMSGSCWGVFTWLMSRWSLDRVAATGAIAISSSLVFAPVYLLLATPTVGDARQWAVQLFYQGALGGALAIVWYNAAVKRLGPTAGVCPALVPPCAIVLAIPMTGTLPNHYQLTGIVTATVGLLVSLNLPALLSKSRSRTRDHGTAST